MGAYQSETPAWTNPLVLLMRKHTISLLCKDSVLCTLYRGYCVVPIYLLVYVSSTIETALMGMGIVLCEEKTMFFFWFPPFYVRYSALPIFQIFKNLDFIKVLFKAQLFSQKIFSKIHSRSKS